MQERCRDKRQNTRNGGGRSGMTPGSTRGGQEGRGRTDEEAEGVERGGTVARKLLSLKREAHPLQSLHACARKRMAENKEKN